MVLVTTNISAIPGMGLLRIIDIINLSGQYSFMTLCQIIQ